MLEHLVSCSFVKRSSPVYLIIAGGVFVIGLFFAVATNINLLIFISSLIAGFFVVLYFVNQEQKIALYCSGKTLHITINRDGIDRSRAFY